MLANSKNWSVCFFSKITLGLQSPKLKKSLIIYWTKSKAHPLECSFAPLVGNPYITDCLLKQWYAISFLNVAQSSLCVYKRNKSYSLSAFDSSVGRAVDCSWKLEIHRSLVQLRLEGRFCVKVSKITTIIALLFNARKYLFTLNWGFINRARVL